MASEMTERFMRALQAMEQSGDAGEMVALFGEGAELRRFSSAAAESGQGGAEQFWREYLSAFRAIRSRFTNVIEADGAAVMEWVSRAEPETAEPFEYEGVSIIEFANGRVNRFRTYYDSARFTPASDQNNRPA